MSTKKKKRKTPTDLFHELPRVEIGDLLDDLAAGDNDREKAENLYFALDRIRHLAKLLGDIEIYDDAETSRSVDTLAGAIRALADAAMSENEV